MLEVSTVRKVCIGALKHAGVTQANAESQIDLLLDAQLKGHASHGLLRLPRLVKRIANGVADPNTVGVASWRGSALLDVDGQNGLGPVVALNALDLVCQRVTETGVAVAAIRNCNHLGMLAWYAERIAEQGKVILAFTISEALVHPWGGRKPMVGTNPIAIGVPAAPRPFVLDMATSNVSMGKIHDYANRGENIPSGWALDAQGNPTTDARAASEGAIAPFGGPKGFALGLGFEVLVASLTASAVGTQVAGTLDADKVCNKGDLFIILDPAAGALASVSAYLQQIRETAPIDRSLPVMVPGDRAASLRMERLATGVPVDPSVWAEIEALPRAAAVE